MAIYCQHNITTFSGASTTVTLASAVPSVNSAFVILRGTSTDTSNDDPPNWSIAGYLHDVSTLHLRRSGLTNSGVGAWIVVHCTSGEFTTQQGSAIVSANILSGTATLGTAVNTSRAFIVHSEEADSFMVRASESNEVFCTSEFLDSTTVAFRKERGTAAESKKTTVFFNVVEFAADAGVSVVTSEVPLSGDLGTSAVLFPLNGTVTASNTFLYTKFRHSSSIGLEQTSITAELSGNTQIGFRRYASTSSFNSWARYYAVNFPSSVSAFTYTAETTNGTDASAFANLFPNINVDRTFLWSTNSTSGTGNTFARNMNTFDYIFNQVIHRRYFTGNKSRYKISLVEFSGWDYQPGVGGDSTLGLWFGFNM